MKNRTPKQLSDDSWLPVGNTSRVDKDVGDVSVKNIACSHIVGT